MKNVCLSLSYLFLCLLGNPAQASEISTTDLQKYKNVVTNQVRDIMAYSCIYNFKGRTFELGEFGNDVDTGTNQYKGINKDIIARVQASQSAKISEETNQTHLTFLYKADANTIYRYTFSTDSSQEAVESFYLELLKAKKGENGTLQETGPHKLWSTSTTQSCDVVSRRR